MNAETCVVRIVHLDDYTTEHSLKEFLLSTAMLLGAIKKVFISKQDQLQIVFAYVIFEYSRDARIVTARLNGFCFQNKILAIELIGPNLPYQRYDVQSSEPNVLLTSPKKILPKVSPRMHLRNKSSSLQNAGARRNTSQRATVTLDSLTVSDKNNVEVSTVLNNSGNDYFRTLPNNSIKADTQTIRNYNKKRSGSNPSLASNTNAIKNQMHQGINRSRNRMPGITLSTHQTSHQQSVSNHITPLNKTTITSNITQTPGTSHQQSVPKCITPLNRTPTISNIKRTPGSHSTGRLGTLSTPASSHQQSVSNNFTPLNKTTTSNITQTPGTSHQQSVPNRITTLNKTPTTSNITQTPGTQSTRRLGILSTPATSHQQSVPNRPTPLNSTQTPAIYSTRISNTLSKPAVSRQQSPTTSPIALLTSTQTSSNRTHTPATSYSTLPSSGFQPNNFAGAQSIIEYKPISIETRRKPKESNCSVS